MKYSAPQLRAAIQAAQITQAQAGRLMLCSTRKVERMLAGDVGVDSACYQLLMIKTGQAVLADGNWEFSLDKVVESVDVPS